MQFLASFPPSSFRYKEINVLLGIQAVFWVESVDSYTKGQNAANGVGEQKFWFSAKFEKSCTFSFSPSSQFVMQETFLKKLLLSAALQLQTCWVKPHCEKISGLFWKSRIWLTKHVMDIQLLAHRAYQKCVAKNQAQQSSFPYVFTSTKKSTDSLMNEMQRLIS